jgi:phage FluMu protein Com
VPKILVRCPDANCQARLSADETALGRKIRCPRCKRIFTEIRPEADLSAAQPATGTSASGDGIPEVWEPGRS